MLVGEQKIFYLMCICMRTLCYTARRQTDEKTGRTGKKNMLQDKLESCYMAPALFQA